MALHPLDSILDLQELTLPLLEYPLDNLHSTEALILALSIPLLHLTQNHLSYPIQDQTLSICHLTQDRILAKNMWFVFLKLTF